MQKDKVVGGHWLPDRRFSPWNLKPFTDVMQNSCSGKSKLTYPLGFKCHLNALGKSMQKRRRDRMHFEKRGLGPGDNSVSTVFATLLGLQGPEKSLVWWHSLVIPALWRWRQADPWPH